jgi:hypothetical protein
MSATQVTEAHLSLLRTIYATSLSIEDDAQLIADSEAKAVSGQNAVIAEWLNRVATVTAERDQLRAEVEQKRNLLTVSIKSAGDQAIRAEKAEVRLAEVETANRDLLHTMKVIAGMWIAATTPLTPADALAERMAKLAIGATLRKHP